MVVVGFSIPDNSAGNLILTETGGVSAVKIVIACDKFKGSMTAATACQAIALGLAEGGHSIREIPVADGGEGMATALTESQNGDWIRCEVAGPLGDRIDAGFGLIEKGTTAVIEMAEASGLDRLGERVNDPWRASTFGTGQLICEAMKRGVKQILLGIGGSATNDGGSGMAEALGFHFLDSSHSPVSGLPENLDEVTQIEFPDRTFPRITVACDVINPLLGPGGCTRIYGPQKGVRDEDIEKHEARLRHLVTLLGAEEFAHQPGAGAAGGLGFGCLAFTGAKLERGFDLIAEALQLEEAIAQTDLVITGEGKIDQQSLQGKAPAGVAKLARKHGKAVIAFCGINETKSAEHPFDEIFEIEREDLDLTASIKAGPRLLRQTTQNASSQFFGSGK